jgi:hypothetical protein
MPFKPFYHAKPYFLAFLCNIFAVLQCLFSC